MIGNPSSRDMKNMLCGDILKNCPITAKYITISDNIFGPNGASVDLKIVIKSLEQVKTD